MKEVKNMNTLRKSVMRGMAEKGVKLQSDIARATGIRPMTISDILRGHANPTHDTLMKLSNYFEVPLSTFIGWGEK